MRTTKSFLEFCFSRARNQISNAISVNDTLIKDFFMSNIGIFCKASHRMHDSEYDQLIEQVKTSYNDLVNSAEALGSRNDSLRNDLNRHFDRLKAAILEGEYNPSQRFMNIRLTVFATADSSDPETTECDTFAIGVNDLAKYHSKVKNKLLEDASCTNVYSYLKESGYYMPELTSLLNNVNDGYSYSAPREQEMDLGYTDKVLTEEQNNKLLGIIKTKKRLKQMSDTIRSHSPDWMQHTTLAKCREDEIIWPIICADPDVKDRIRTMEEREERRKLEREAKLKAEREAAAAKRKAQLEALEAGEEYEDDSLSINKSDANLVRAINRLGDS